MSLRSCLRIFWRDFLLAGLKLSESFDEKVIGRLFLDSGSQHIWSNLDVHRTMLEDDVRVEAFRRAIEESVGSEDTVLDVGTGLGILAFFAARKAGKVYAVDSSNVIEYAKKIATENDISNIEFMRSDIKDLSVPKVNCIIAELIGMEIIDEGIVEKISSARKFLKDQGKIIPNRIDVYVVPVESTEIGFGFWGKLYGIDFSQVDGIPKMVRNFTATEKTRRLSSDLKAFSIDLMNDSVKNVSCELEFPVENEGVFHGCLCYFRAHLSENVVLDASPESPLTHWKQMFLNHNERVKVSKGDVIEVKLKTKNRLRGWDWNYSIKK